MSFDVTIVIIKHVENSKFTIFDEFASPLNMGAGQIVSNQVLGLSEISAL